MLDGSAWRLCVLCLTPHDVRRPRLVGVAGASQHALAAETTGQVAEKLLQLNTLAPIRLTQAVLPHMIKRCV
jgi:NADP-dependent 3-hydroxy acid dehydrogenase YdfG